MGKNFRETLNAQLDNPEFKDEWEKLEPEFQVIRAMLQGRKDNHLTQQQLADKTGITQADISRLENGEANPSLNTLKRIAEALGKKLKVEFVPIKEKQL